MENYAGKECNEELIIELETAGIPVVVHEENVRSEPITNVIGLLHGWTFERVSSRWVVVGTGIPLEIANPMNQKYKSDMRIRYAMGLSVYDIDTQEALNVFSACLKWCHALGVLDEKT